MKEVFVMNTAKLDAIVLIGFMIVFPLVLATQIVS